MKHWKCPYCANEHETEDNIKFVVCRSCLTEMKEFPYSFKKEVEVGNHEGNQIYSD